MIILSCPPSGVSVAWDDWRATVSPVKSRPPWGDNPARPLDGNLTGRISPSLVLHLTGRNSPVSVSVAVLRKWKVLDWIFLVSKHCGSDYQEIPTLWRRLEGKYYNIINQNRTARVNYNENLSDHFIIHLNRNTEVQSHEGRGRAM